MDPTKRYPILAPLLASFEIRHQKTLSVVIAAITVAGTARSFGIAAVMARWMTTRVDSAVNRFYRLLRNPRVDNLTLTAHLARCLARGPQRRVLVAIDWTEWSRGLRMLVAAAVVDRRAIPLWCQAFEKLVGRRSQNARENDFVRLLARGLREAGVQATLLCDRGFRRLSWLKLLDDLRLSFVVRLVSDVTVEHEGQQRTLREIPLRRRRIVDLGQVPLRADGALTVRVVGYWAPGAREPWWVATNLTCAPSHVLSLYDRRMAIEEQFRDTKGKRFGVKLGWTQFRDPQALARFAMLLAIPLLIWTLQGIAAEGRDTSCRMPCRRKGPRLSYVTVGLGLIGTDREVILTLAVARALLPPPALRRIAGTRRGGK